MLTIALLAAIPVASLADLTAAALGILGALFGGLAWYKGAVEKDYASQRDFNHLKNSFNTLAQALEQLAEKIDEVNSHRASQDRDLHDIKASLASLERTAIKLEAMLSIRQTNPPIALPPALDDHR